MFLVYLGPYKGRTIDMVHNHLDLEFVRYSSKIGLKESIIGNCSKTDGI